LASAALASSTRSGITPPGLPADAYAPTAPKNSSACSIISPTRRAMGSFYSDPLRHGPVIANVMPGVWMFANSQLPLRGSNVEPAHSRVE
jgi:hypothetical protein